MNGQDLMPTDRGDEASWADPSILRWKDTNSPLAKPSALTCEA